MSSIFYYAPMWTARDTNATLSQLGGAAEKDSVDFADESERHPSAFHRATADILKGLGVFDRALSDRPYLLGSSYSLADTHLTTLMPRLTGIGVDLAQFPSLSRWTATCNARPAFASAEA